MRRSLILAWGLSSLVLHARSYRSTSRSPVHHCQPPSSLYLRRWLVSISSIDFDTAGEHGGRAELMGYVMETADSRKPARLRGVSTSGGGGGTGAGTGADGEEGAGAEGVVAERAVQDDGVCSWLGPLGCELGAESTTPAAAIDSLPSALEKKAPAWVVP